MLEQPNGLLDLPVGLVGSSKLVLRGEPVGVVFGECCSLDSDDVLKQLNSLPNLPVSLAHSS